MRLPLNPLPPVAWGTFAALTIYGMILGLV
jgi:hypothetical protein